MSRVLKCNGCGGSVAYDAAAEVAACLFCGSVKLEPGDPREELSSPNSKIPVDFGKERADEQYREWATSSWWYPNELRSLQVELRCFYLPAWRFHATVETHWAGLVSAHTRSGKQPMSGQNSNTYYHMIPASGGLDQDELDELLPFDEAPAIDWTDSDDEDHLPYEVPAITEHAAQVKIHDYLADVHRGQIANANGLYDCRSSSHVVDDDVKLYMLPVYIGAFRFRDKPWRFLVNGQSGKLVGEAPIDRVKVAAVTIGTIVGLLILNAFLV